MHPKFSPPCISVGTRRVHCNEVYQEYIKDKNHFHMNATRWETLTGFVKWLGREGYCEVDPTPKGWFIRYIDRSPEALARQAVSLQLLSAVGSYNNTCTYYEFKSEYPYSTMLWQFQVMH